MAVQSCESNFIESARAGFSRSYRQYDGISSYCLGIALMSDLIVLVCVKLLYRIGLPFTRPVFFIMSRLHDHVCLENLC